LAILASDEGAVEDFCKGIKSEIKSTVNYHYSDQGIELLSQKIDYILRRLPTLIKQSKEGYDHLQKFDKTYQELMQAMTLAKKEGRAEQFLSGGREEKSHNLSSSSRTSSGSPSVLKPSELSIATTETNEEDMEIASDDDASPSSPNSEDKSHPPSPSKSSQSSQDSRHRKTSSCDVAPYKVTNDGRVVHEKRTHDSAASGFSPAGKRRKTYPNEESLSGRS
jgi:hypothetical protein